MELFDNDSPRETNDTRKPLADRMRPKTLDELVGQEHILGEGKILKILLQKKDVPSMILWGPSGVGKTTLGWLMGKYMRLPYVSLSAVNIGIKEVREIIQKSKHQKIILNPNDASRGAKVSYVDRETSRQFIITVPRGIKEGQTIRLKGAGENSAYRGRIEDLYLKVQFRKSLSQKAKDFYKRLMS